MGFGMTLERGDFTAWAPVGTDASPQNACFPCRPQTVSQPPVRTPAKGYFGADAAVVRRHSSIARPSHRMCAVSQRLCVGRVYPSQLMCAGNWPLLCVEAFIIARRYRYYSDRMNGAVCVRL